MLGYHIPIETTIKSIRCCWLFNNKQALAYSVTQVMDDAVTSQVWVRHCHIVKCPHWHRTARWACSVSLHMWRVASARRDPLTRTRKLFYLPRWARVLYHQQQATNRSRSQLLRVVSALNYSHTLARNTHPRTSASCWLCAMQRMTHGHHQVRVSRWAACRFLLNETECVEDFRSRAHTHIITGRCTYLCKTTTTKTTTTTTSTTRKHRNTIKR